MMYFIKPSLVYFIKQKALRHHSYLIVLLLQLFSNGIKSQNDFVNRSYVDFHAHTILKNYYRNVKHPENAYQLDSAGRNADWQIYDSKQKNRGDFNNIHGIDQATYPLLNAGHASIICTSIYTLEKQSVSNKTLPVSGLFNHAWIRIPLQYSILFPFDHIFSMRLINKIAVTGINMSRQRTAYDPKVSNFKEFTAQLEYLKNQYTHYPSFKAIELAGPGSDLNDTSKIWLVLTAEGAHNFYGESTSTLKKIMGHRINKAQESEMLNNLDSIKNEYRLLFITPAHLFENKVAGGARGLDIDKTAFRSALSKLMWDRRFSSIDNKDIEGINKDYYENESKRKSSCNCEHTTDTPVSVNSIGWDFIDEMKKPNKYGKKTFIDLRHMDVKARMEIMDSVIIWNQTTDKEDPIPLIVSHAAVSGKSMQMAEFLGLCPFYDDYSEFTPTKIWYYYTSKIDSCGSKMGFSKKEQILDYLTGKSGWFHPMSNNLFDEEIKAVYKTQGIIGITLEERALGWNAYNYTVNEKTFMRLFNYFDTAYKKADKDFIKKSILLGEPFIRNLFYIVEMSDTTGVEAWKHIAIGSDFDGIMNPIDLCPTAADIPNFYSFLCNNLSFYADYLGKHDLLFDQKPSDLMDLLFFKNGESFIKKHF